MSSDSKNITGFTLAEILITLLVVGVVASITVPAIINDVRNKDLELENNTLRGILQRAHQQIRTENGGTVHGLNYAYEMANKLNLVKNCNAHSQTNGCWHAGGVVRILQSNGSYKNLTATNYSYGLVLQNGIMMLLGSGTLNCGDRTTTSSNTMACYKGTHYYSGFCTTFLADINGKRPPNIYGQDVREIVVYNNKVSIYGDTLAPRWNSERNYDVYDANAWQSGGGCYSSNVYTHTKY